MSRRLKFLSILGLAWVAICLSAWWFFLRTNSATVDAAIRAALPSTVISSIKPSVIDGLYEVKAGDNTLYTTASGRYLVVGHIYDLKTAQDLTQPEGGAAATAAATSPATAGGMAATGMQSTGAKPEAATANRIGWYNLPLEGAVHWGTPGKPKLAIWSDTHCPYCQQLHQGLQPLAGEFDIYEILFPVHTEAKAGMAAVLCAKDPQAALDAAFAGNPSAFDASAEPCVGKLDAVVQTAVHLGIEGTPTLVAGDGRVQEGVTDIQQLRAWLQQPATH